ncbi:MAG TPA: DUF1501 domain-containing protein [Humisphaera sp.]
MSLYDHRPNPAHRGLSRRQLLERCGMGMGAIGLAGLMSGLASPSPAAAADVGGYVNPLAARPAPFPARAKRVVHFFLNGGPSHVDTFDPKPLLAKYAGKPVPGGNLPTERKTGGCLPSPFAFRRCGRSGLEVSDLFPHLGALADELCVIRSMKAEVPNHEPSLMLMNCGDQQMARPSFGAWVTYGLGTENQNLPGFVAMCPGGYPIKEAENWQSGFLPGVFQGTYVDSKHDRIERLIENVRPASPAAGVQRRQLDLLRQLNAEHQQDRPADPRLEARIQSFELAYRMQMEAADAFDVANEPEHVRAMYGDMGSVHARQTLVARRLLERGVRFVQLWHGAGQPWDNHGKVRENHAKLAREIDRPIAALIRDLRQRGMLDDTLILIGGEFGRTPVSEGGDGRDHNPYGFSVVLAGGGVRGGTAHGATDELGFKAVDKVAEVHDLHATMLHLLGFDHERFTYRYAGRDFRLTDVRGKVLRDVLA